MSHARKYQTLPNLRKHKNYVKSKEKDISRSLFDTLFYSFGGGEKAMKRIDVYDGTEYAFDRKTKKCCVVEDVSNHVYCTSSSGHGPSFTRQNNTESNLPSPAKHQKQIVEVDESRYYEKFDDRRRDRDKTSKKSRQSELEAIIRRIHTNLACREALNGKQFSTDDERLQFPGTSQSYLRIRSQTQPDIQEPHLRRNRSLESGYEDTMIVAGDNAKSVSRSLAQTMDGEHQNCQINRQFKSRVGERDTKSNKNCRNLRRRKEYVDDNLYYEDLECPNILDENEDLFRHLQKLESADTSLNIKHYLQIDDRQQETINNLNENIVNDEINFDRTYKSSLKNTRNEQLNAKYFDDPRTYVAVRQPADDSGDKFCHILYDTHSNIYDVVDNVTYFTGADDHLDDSNHIPNEVNESSVPEVRRRVSGRRDRAVWSDTLHEAQGSVGTTARVEGRGVGWWKTAGPRKDIKAKDNGPDIFLTSTVNKRYNSKDQACGPVETYDIYATRENHQPKKYYMLRKAGSKRPAANDSGGGSDIKNATATYSASSQTSSLPNVTIGRTSCSSTEGRTPETTMTEAPEGTAPSTPQVK